MCIRDRFNDFNSNGLLDPGEPGLANFTLYLDSNGNNVLDPNEPASISNVAGDYSFNNLPLGTYFLREIPQPNFAKTTPDKEITIVQPINILQGDPPIVLNVGNAVITTPAPESQVTETTSGGDITTGDITGGEQTTVTNNPEDATRTGSQVTGTGRIAGTKFNDLNGNNAIDAEEPGLPGFTVYLDLNEDKELSAGEPQSMTDVEGRYLSLIHI